MKIIPKIINWSKRYNGFSIHDNRLANSLLFICAVIIMSAALYIHKSHEDHQIELYKAYSHNPNIIEDISTEEHG